MQAEENETDDESLSMLFHYLIQPISLMFCGHLGKTDLAAASLAISVIYIVCVSVGRGLAFGADTYFSQLYGGTNKKLVGLYLQKCFFLILLTCFPIVAIFLNIQSLLLLLKQDAEVSAKVQQYVLYFSPGILNRVIANLIICIISCVINAILHYGLVYQAKMGIIGSAISLALTYYLTTFQLFAYIWGCRIYRETWDGWTWDCLKKWGPISKTAALSIFMTVLFWLCTECGTFLAGGLPNSKEAIATFSIMFQLEGFAFMVPLGLGGACTARVGQHLGSNNPNWAKVSCRVSLIVQGAISLIFAMAVYMLKDYIPKAFTSNQETANYTASMMYLVCIFILLEGVGGVGIGIIRGTGRQGLGAILIFTAYYVLALPIGIVLMFKTKLALLGLWLGYIIGIFAEDLFVLIFVAKLNFEKEAAKAAERSNISNIINEEPVASVNDINENIRKSSN
ncbi:DgyrCDS3666 [Dimorphilus gyrociliatus]|uniref:Multidrug and toxin extrusion protein n=1 Tax=Dimorphilus gyrociliatus TaxID=2664684 RepID=A0A7I8VJ04_9ANNE|nr:DgyrCDS3666 [Dimorphilus gyrociliatus]